MFVRAHIASLLTPISTVPDAVEAYSAMVMTASVSKILWMLTIQSSSLSSAVILPMIQQAVLADSWSYPFRSGSS